MAELALLNHVEMVYRAGGREAARQFFTLMGFEVSDLADIGGGPHLAIKVDAGIGQMNDNVMYANEATPAQQNFEAALRDALAADARLAETLERYRAVRWAHPQYVFHFGASVPTHEQWQERVDRLVEANRSDPLLKDRLNIKIGEPGVPGHLGIMSQAFIHTDILACGPFPAAELLFDLQWRPASVPGVVGPIEFPDMARMV